jgi:rare lipoprotein A
MRKIIATLLLLGFLSPAWAATQDSPSEHGIATVYAMKFVGRRTADGEQLDRVHLTAAHRTLPFGTVVEVTNRANGRKAIVRINDRGPHRRHAVIDLSPAAAAVLGLGRRGSAPVVLQIAQQP